MNTGREGGRKNFKKPRIGSRLAPSGVEREPARKRTQSDTADIFQGSCVNGHGNFNTTRKKGEKPFFI